MARNENNDKYTSIQGSKVNKDDGEVSTGVIGGSPQAPIYNVGIAAPNSPTTGGGDVGIAVPSYPSTEDYINPVVTTPVYKKPTTTPQNKESAHEPVYMSQSNDYDISSLNSDMMRIRENLSIGNPSRTGYTDTVVSQMFKYFNRWNMAFPDYHLQRTHVKVFFTRPDLNILTSSSSLSSYASQDPLYLYVFNNEPEIFRNLTKYGSTSHDFNVFLSNTAESFEVSDEYIKSVEVAETFTGHRLYYGRNDIDSKGAGEISIKYTDDYNLDIFKTHKIWVDYISKAYRGEFSPKDEYKQAKILDYAVAVYYFLLGPDGETILFWSKFTGVFPTNTASSSFSWDKDSMLKKPEISIKYNYSFKNDLDPAHLSEFNTLTTPGSYVSSYEEMNFGMGKTWVGPPMVIASKNSKGNTIYKLKWSAM